MNKKILSICIGAVGIILLATFTSAVGLQAVETKKEESPLFGIRTESVIGENVKKIKENIFARFIKRLFVLNFIEDSSCFLSEEQAIKLRERIVLKPCTFGCGPTAITVCP